MPEKNPNKIILKAGKQIDDLFNLIAKEIQTAVMRYQIVYKEPFWKYNKLLYRAVNQALKDLKLGNISIITNSVKQSWDLANKDIDQMMAEYLKKSKANILLEGEAFKDVAKVNLIGIDVPKEWMQHNESALNALTNRTTQGMTPSGRVWNISLKSRQMIEQTLKSGVLDGTSSADMSRILRQALKNPNALFRRVRNKETGKLELSAPAKNYHPGRGVYRSAYKNALRLCGTETNMAYRFAEFERYQQIPFIIGYEVHLSNAHPRRDICFTNWNFKVLTSKGWITINKVKENDLVLTHKGKFQRVLKKYKTTAHEVDKTEIYYKLDYDNRGKTHKISATNNHPFLVNGQWLHISKIKEGDKVRLLANRCKKCDKLIPYTRDYCSKSCSSFVTATNQWSKESHKLSLSEKRKKVISENNGHIPWLKEYIASGKNTEVLLKGSTRINAIKASRETSIKKLALGIHQFQDINNHKKANRALASKKYCTYIEKKMEWLLLKLKINHEKGVLLYRNELNKFGVNRFYKPDFILSDYKIVIECDGEYWHQDKDADLKRQREIEEMGYRVLRFSGNEIRNNIEHISNEIESVIKNHENKYEFIDIEIIKVSHYTQKQSTPITKYNLEVENDNSYIVNGFVVHNCDSMKGEYPKTFTFIGWHPQCFCYVTSIMLDDKDFKKYLDTGKISHQNYIKEMPKSAVKYLKDNEEKINNLSDVPYWIRQNTEFINNLWP